MRNGWRAYKELSKELKGVVAFRKRVLRELEDGAVLTDWFGRKHWFGEFYSGAREEAHRAGMNFLIQGPAASVMKVMMKRLDRELRGGYETRMLLSVHDEVVLECPIAEVSEVAQILKSSTQGIMPITLPVEVKVGRNWGEMRVYG